MAMWPRGFVALLRCFDGPFYSDRATFSGRVAAGLSLSPGALLLTLLTVPWIFPDLVAFDPLVGILVLGYFFFGGGGRYIWLW